MNRFRTLFLLSISSSIVVAVHFPPTLAAVESTDGIAGRQEPEASAGFIPDIFSYRLPYRTQIDLNGTWEFRRDPDDIGAHEGWPKGQGTFIGNITIPGVPQAQGYGEPHQYQRTLFMEPFWMRRSFEIPEIEEDDRIWLRLGGVLPAAEIYLNGRYVGFTKSSRTQQRVDITDHAKVGTENLIAVKVCDFPDVRMDGLLEWNEGTQKWMGAYRPIYCEIANRTSIVDAYIQPDLETDSISVDVELTQTYEKVLKVVLQVKDGAKTVGRKTVTLPAEETRVSTEIPLSGYETWAPEHPQLYTLEIAIRERWSRKNIDHVGLRFGMREISTKGTKFYLNGKPIYLRCFGDDHYYPETLCPPWDIDWYLSRLKLARAYGMNAVKGCVETTPQDYIEACDEAGILVIQEMPFGLSTLRANRHTIDKRFRDYYASELEGLVRVSRNHASVLAYSMSSELSHGAQTQESFDFFNSGRLPERTRQLAPHALAIDCTGYVNSMETEKGTRNTDFYASVHPLWMKDVLDEADMKTDERVPMILHEYNWWSNYPNPEDRSKYAAAQLKPFWLDTLVDTAWKNGQSELIPLYHKNSLWLQALARKDGIEYARRNRLVEGYILWLLIDFGHWSEGLLDDFWNPKNVTPEEFSKSNGDTVILLAEEGNRCLEMGSPGRIPLAISHYGEDELADSTLKWKVTGVCGVQNGEMKVDSLTQGELTAVGDVEFEMPLDDKAYKCELETAFFHGDRRVNTNNWSFWAFPKADSALRSMTNADSVGHILPEGIFARLYGAKAKPIPPEAELVVASAVDAPLADYLESGGRCILFPHGAAIENTVPYHGQSSFYPIYRTIPWNAGSSGNSGTVIAHHPAMEAFPHEGLCDLPFVSMLRGFLPMEFTPLRRHGVTPIIRGIDHYYSNRNNAYLLEFNVGEGKVLVCSMGVLKELKPNTTSQANWGNAAAFVPNRTIQAQYLLKCFVDYAQSGRFVPPATVPREEFLRLFRIRDDFTKRAVEEGHLLM